MSPCVLIAALFTLSVAVAEGEEEVQRVCVGNAFRLPVYSTYRTVVFTPSSEGTKRVLLEKTMVKDPRFEWTRDKMLVLREVTYGDQGLYAVKNTLGFTFEAVHLVVLECIRSFHRHYGESFEHSIPENGSLLEFSPRGAPHAASPIVLWNETDPETSSARRGRLLHSRRVWVAERVTQADQGNYTVRDVQGNVLSHRLLIVRGHSFNVTRFTKESLNLPLFLPIPHVHLIFIPTRHPDEYSAGPFDPKPPRGAVQLIREGHITDYDMRYRGLISLGRNGSLNEVVISRLTSRHDGVYEIRDDDGNLVSSTLLQVIEKGGRWRALLKSITVPSGMFVSLAGFILFMKRYPNCSLSQIITGLRTNRTPAANPPRVNIQDYSQPVSEPSSYYSHAQQPGTPRKWTPRTSPAHASYSPVMIGSPRTETQQAYRAAARSSPSHASASGVENSIEEDKQISFSVSGASNCLQSSEDCIQFQINRDGNEEKRSSSQGFSTLPLDEDTSGLCSVYTSEKLNFL
ncbi:uncharacterized protein LOC114864581 isoform X2 [Betta splendens]|uniref:Uncharacterized protein LOC114864581 isoform X2 n=1 Tax=Betta splendens TaxID=158456 RepID=A0A6P7NN75_BETSP|nr:uncharacterized protein LOC114864581 isoform X2 [Betta splendens]